jgi:hypothetical protein
MPNFDMLPAKIRLAKRNPTCILERRTPGKRTSGIQIRLEAEWLEESLRKWHNGDFHIHEGET